MPSGPQGLSLVCIPIPAYSLKMVQSVGVEPTQPFGHKALNLARLPNPPRLHNMVPPVGVEPTLYRF